MDINDMSRKAYRNSYDHGFWDDEPPFGQAPNFDVNYIGNKLMLIVGEVSEAHEELRKGARHYYQENGKPEGIGPELADVLIRVGDLAYRLDIDLSALIEEKMAYNETRPYKHGKTM